MFHRPPQGKQRLQPATAGKHCAALHTRGRLCYFLQQVGFGFAQKGDF
jgi:hypothetical protein